MTKLTMTAQGERDVVVTRDFAAPREKVWRAVTDTQLMRQWMTSDYGALKSLEGEAVVGGQHRFVWAGEDEDLVMVATYDLLEPPELIRHRETCPQHDYMESLVETRLIDAGGMTKMQMTITFASAEAREQALSFGMAEGMEVMYANLDLIIKADTA
ncbi:SRPBCC family protein [Paracoccus tegillarcae]|uniref:Activator of Hsp90 ATPase homologue 1/2-like C-terminal domain-containing protein n=1 Tax=Paracoccus tegillarcae TaxID=1529068 RepID=A0A2K9EXT6_9RHOB|nr:SRPBCC domain-containing protein [Paracoccus tegillarcae]AUH34124.1 hypothetical protein CUV01_12605 [Paracoccus tegillarcae]